MSLQNVELVRGLTEVLEREGLAAALPRLERACDERVEWVEDPSWPGGGTYRGLTGLRAVLAERTDSFEFDLHTEKLIDAGDDVVTLVRWRGRGHRSGAEADMQLAVVYTLRRERITRVRFYLDRAEALEAVGL